MWGKAGGRVDSRDSGLGLLPSLGSHSNLCLLALRDTSLFLALFFFFVTHDMAITPAFFGAADWEPAGRAGLCGGGGHPALRGLRAGVTSFAWSTRVWSGEHHGGQAMELSPQFEELPLAWGRTAVTSLIQQILVEYLLCARHRSKCGDAAGNKTGRNLCLRADDILVGSGKGRGGRGSR